MTRNSVVAFFAITLLAAAVTLRADSPTTQADLTKENAELKAKVEALRQQNAELTKKTESLQAEIDVCRAVAARTRELLQKLEKEKLESSIQGLRFAPADPAQPNLMIPQKSNPTPPGAIEREFNGVTYYIVPLGQQ
jgi:predicted  nucleic acid-binding Zn-ribbon protein